jgi:hypothetical protein
MKPISGTFSASKDNNCREAIEFEALFEKGACNSSRLALTRQDRFSNNAC